MSSMSICMCSVVGFVVLLYLVRLCVVRGCVCCVFSVCSVLLYVCCVWLHVLCVLCAECLFGSWLFMEHVLGDSLWCVVLCIVFCVV